MSRSNNVVVSISKIKELIQTGTTRCIGDPGYDETKGSIEQYYNLRKSEVKLLFQDPRLRGLRVNSVAPSRIIIAEDEPMQAVVQAEASPELGFEESTEEAVATSMSAEF